MPQVTTTNTRSIQGEPLAAMTDRLANVILSEGVVDLAGNSFKVAQDTGSNMNIKVGSGTALDRCVVASDELGGGVYILQHEDAFATLAVAAADVTDDRIDIVVVRVYDDTFDSSGNDYGDIEIITGVAAAIPVAPALPNGAIQLATISVQNGVTAITNSDITDNRTSAGFIDEVLGDIWSVMWPVGSIYISAVSTNPATLFGGGTWAQFGQGKTPVSRDSGDTDFDTAEETGGAKTHTHTQTHTHQVDPPATNTSAPITGGSDQVRIGSDGATDDDHTHSVNIAAFTSGGASAGSTQSGSSLQPYTVVYMWKRTA